MTGAAVAGELLPAAAAPPGGVLAVPGGPDAANLLTAWLIACARTADSVRSYRSVAEAWCQWCAAAGVDVVDAGRVHVDAWVQSMQATPTARTGRPPSQATLAHRVAVVSSLYGYLLDEGWIERSPVRRRGRPKAPAESTTVGLSALEVAAVLARCRAHESVLDWATVAVLLGCGLRVSEAAALDVGDVVPEQGETVLTVTGKGRKVRTVPAGGEVVEALTAHVEARAAAAGVEPDGLPVDAPLLATVAGGRLVPRTVTRTVQRIARAAGVTSWSRLSPHSLRHTYATLLLDAGATIDVVQDLLGHASTNTTRRYDRSRGSLRRKAAAVQRLDVFLAGSTVV